MEKRYIDIGIDPLSLSNQELQILLGNEGPSSLIRSILMSEVKRCQVEAPEQRTLRNLWYDVAKPIISRLGILDRYDPKKGQKTWDQRVSERLVELVDDGETDYALLGIVDSSRQRKRPNPYNFTPSQLGYDFMTTPVVEPHDPGILIVSEKDTVFHILNQIASIYGIGAYSCGGQSAYAAVENYLYRLAKRFGIGTNLYVLVMTDYDPHGDIIYDGVIDHISKTARRCGLSQPDPKRIGIFPDQLPEERLLQNAYEPPNKGLDKWFARTDGVMGQKLGLELDSLSFTEIREIYVDAVEEVIASHDPHYETIATATVKMLIFEAMKEEVEDRYQSIYDRIDGDSLIDGMSCDTDVIAGFAKIGDPYIHPITDDIFDEVANVRAQISDLLKEENENG